MIARAVDVVPLAARRRVKYIPIVREIQRWLISRLSQKSFEYVVTAGPAAGIRFLISLPDDKGIWTGTYESEFSALIARSVSAGACCYDIGGFHGYIAGVMAVAGAARVCIFEPNPDNRARLDAMVALNPSRPFEVVPVAVGAIDTTAEFSVMSEGSMGKLRSSSFQRDADSNSTIHVAVRAIDGMVSTDQVPPPDLIKIDVEGAEVDVLRGGWRTISNRRPIIFLEVHSHALGASCRALLDSLGYSWQALEPGPQYPQHVLAIPAVERN